MASKKHEKLIFFPITDVALDIAAIPPGPQGPVC